MAADARSWGVEILVNNARPFSEHSWQDADPQAWLSAYDGNVVSAVRLIRRLVPPMRERGWGRVIQVGSRAATTPLSNVVACSAAKAAVVNMTTSLAQHLAGTGITANTVSPGVILTEGLQAMFAERAALESWTSDSEAQQAHAAAEYAPEPRGAGGISSPACRVTETKVMLLKASPRCDRVG